MAKRKSKKGRFRSKAQWRWAFANKKSWARKWAHKTPGGKKVRYRKLPRKKGMGKKRRKRG
ncbi:gp9 [Mycobacterium phage Barnyard]|uniref:Uncharacterized protein n=1 Tax=Mycobacterium phage Barnyard TaxID=205880 RepID=Q856G3_9CAUD|nr:gp9 [Mycobacterium phage Barnyard]AAN02063.1 hypothetical protein PBI_BARNYARD_9 [Mycobacterium phage Barnyard]